MGLRFHRARPALLVGTGIAIGILVSTAWGALGGVSLAQPSGNCQTFSQTGHTVCGRFLTYWKTHGGLAQQGYPISEEFVETSDLNGKPYTVQYFERAVFEYHPEYAPPNDVLLSQLGTYLGRERYTQGFPAKAGQVPFYEERHDPVHALLSYYNAINRKEYERAYGYFEGAPNPMPDLAPPYQQWVQGYANTSFVSVAAGKVVTGAAAGSIYATFPVVLNAKQTNGSVQVFSGCYTMRRNSEGLSPDPSILLWRIYSAKLTQVPANSSVDQLLAQNCQP